MKTARNLSLLALAIAAASPAFATKCPDGLDYSQHPEGRCDWYYQGTDPTRPASAGSTSEAASNAAAGAAAGAVAGVKNSSSTSVIVDASGAPVSAEQRQQQQQAQQQALNNRNSLASTSGGGAGGVGTGGNVTIQGNQAGSGDSYRSTFTAWAPVALGASAAAVPTALMAPIVRKCGPRVYLENVPVMGQVIGPFGGLSQVKLGERTVVNPAEVIGGDSFLIENVYEETILPNGYKVREIVGQRMIGHEIAGYAAVLTTSSAQSFSLGAFSGGNGAQGGAAGSAGMQQQNQLLNAFDCVYRERSVVKVKIEINVQADPVVATPKPRPPVKRRAPAKAKPCPVCCTPAVAPICPAPAAK